MNTAENDLFLFKINYNAVENDINQQVQPLYNGNISETFWRTRTDDVLRKYGYQYDNLNRLTNSFYQRPDNAVPVTNMYNEQITYDKNGNIQFMHRNGDYDSDTYGPIEIDSLVYYYDGYNKNLLLKVTDWSGSPKGFRDDTFGNNDGNNDYDYDVNGNMIRDDNKNIESISYNHLNMPIQINFGTGNKIKYLYDALGQKVAKTVTVDSNDAVTDYLDGYQYSDSILNFFPHAEGYVNVTYCPECQTEFQQRYNYVYQYKDHLGNIRVSFGYDEKDDVLKIIEENHYYPFGLKHTKYNTGKYKYEPDEEFPELMKLKQVPAGEQVLNKYKYNGKEYQDELGLNWYDYGARNYDPAIGRWMNIDPMAEKYYGINPYAYVFNNPIELFDPNGMEVEFVRKEGQSRKEFRQLKREFKRENRQLMKDSKTHRDNFNQLKDSKNMHQISFNKGGGSETTTVGARDRINGNGSAMDIDLTQMGAENEFVVAHEVAHGVDNDNGVDSPVELPEVTLKMSPLDVLKNIFNTDFENRKANEASASHVENIVRGEVSNSRNVTVPLRETYDIKQEFVSPFSGKRDVRYVPINVKKEGYDYYKKTD